MADVRRLPAIPPRQKAPKKQMLTVTSFEAALESFLLSRRVGNRSPFTAEVP